MVVNGGRVGYNGIVNHESGEMWGIRQIGVIPFARIRPAQLAYSGLAGNIESTL